MRPTSRVNRDAVPAAAAAAAEALLVTAPGVNEAMQYVPISCSQLGDSCPPPVAPPPIKSSNISIFLSLIMITKTSNLTCRKQQLQGHGTIMSLLFKQHEFTVR